MTLNSIKIHVGYKRTVKRKAHMKRIELLPLPKSIFLAIEYD